MSLDGLQTFCPTDSDAYDSGSVPLEVLLDYRCESDSFDRIVPQTNANCLYDRFNRLRLRNNVASAAYSKSEPTHRGRQAHLQNDTVEYPTRFWYKFLTFCKQDLVQVHVPRFTVSANDRHFQFISDIITHLILFSDVAHKARLEKLETLLFAYDFTDLRSAASVVSDLQSRLRSVLEVHNDVSRQKQDNRPQTTLQILKLKAHIFLLVEELNMIFDAIRLAQSRTDGHSDHKSALLLQASSSEISWRMLDDDRDLLAKLAVRDIDFSWLSKQDSSTVNRLTVGDLQAFDGSPNAVWTEIVSKYGELSNHPLYKVSSVLGHFESLSPYNREIFSSTLIGQCLHLSEGLQFMRNSNLTSIPSACSSMLALASVSWNMSGLLGGLGISQVHSARLVT